MCNNVCKELKGWCKSFTRTETLLSILEAILLVIFVVFLVFVCFHLTVCSKTELSEPPQTVTPKAEVPRNYTTPAPPIKVTYPTLEGYRPSDITIGPKVECTWQPSHKTSSVTRYFDITTELAELGDDDVTPSSQYSQSTAAKTHFQWRTLVTHSEQSDGEESDDIFKRNILALAKIRPGKDVTFGCILTIVSKFWVITAASCIEAIEEVDSLDSFVMVEGWGGAVGGGRSHAVSDVRVHPLYQGSNRSHDLVALRAEDALLRAGDQALRRASIVDYFLVTIGERFTVLGFGRFRKHFPMLKQAKEISILLRVFYVYLPIKGANERTVDTSPGGRQLRQTSVHTLPSSQCAVTSEDFELRHIVPGGVVEHPPCGAAPLCAGVLYTRGTPCNYCAGTPLLYGATLYGLMSDNQQCGVACEPALYVNIANVQTWLDTVVGDQ